MELILGPLVFAILYGLWKESSAITLYYLSGYSIKDIATITEISEDAVKKQEVSDEDIQIDFNHLQGKQEATLRHKSMNKT